MNARFFATTTLAAALLATPALHAASVKPIDFVPYLPDADSKESALYNDGTKAINESRWSDAESLFTKVADLRGQYAEGALYWKAYAENKEGQTARALETCSRLRRAYAHSKWLDECGALEIEIRSKTGHPADPQAEQDDDLKGYALLAVMQQDEARALPIIQKILTSNNSSDHLKKKALFILSQSNSRDAQNLLGQIARGQSNPALQIEAIRMLSIRDKQSNDILADIYQHTSDANVKKAILQSYLVSGSKDKLLEAARNEKDPQLVHTAVQQLGAMGATSEMLDLYRNTSNTEIKSSIIGAFIASGKKGADALSTIATSEQNPDLRRKAIRNLGIAGGASAAPAIVSIYQNSTDPETKKAAADALFLCGDAHDLVALAKTEKDPEAKAAIVSKLGIMHNKEATDYMLEILNK
jgi:HEAT repeat protein